MQGCETVLRAGSVQFAFLGCGVDETKGDGTADNLRVTLSIPPSVGLDKNCHHSQNSVSSLTFIPMGWPLEEDGT